MDVKSVRFNNTKNEDFQNILRKRVNAYFKDNKISKTGNFKLYFKTFVMYTLYFGPFVLLAMNVFESKWMWLLLAALMGFGMAGIGMSVMHDANHGSYSKNQGLNKFIGFFSMAVLAGNALNWKIQHNIIHHTYTNVHELDEDITSMGFLRFEPHSPKKKIHKYQFIYAWFFYGLMTVMWSTVKDFKQLNRYNKMGFIKEANTTYAKELTVIILSKIVYYAYMLIPYFLIPEMSFLNWVVGLFVMHYVAGLTLAMVFQLAHVTDVNEYPLPQDNMLENNFIEHQLRTTMNFATKNKFVSYISGGLNFQVEHHLFPAISHVHYPAISEIVKDTAAEYAMPYNVERTFFGALGAHVRMLKQLGAA